MRYFKKLVGERVYLSPMRADDAEQYTAWVNDIEISIKLMAPAEILSVTLEKEHLDDLIKNRKNFSIVTLNDDELIGACGLLNINQVNRFAEAGIFIGNKNYWHQGYGSEAMNLLLGFGFNMMNLHSIMLCVREYNFGAINCYCKCGFKEIGRRREAIIYGNKRYDLIYMDILASEYPWDINDLIREGDFRL